MWWVWPAVVFGTLAAIFLGGVVVSRCLRGVRASRTIRLREVAERLRVPFLADADGELPHGAGGFALFSHRDGRTVRNVLTIEDGRFTHRLFDYEFERRYGHRDSERYELVKRTVVLTAAEQDAGGWPTFSLIPRGRFGRLFAAADSGTLTFEARPTLSRSHAVKAQDEAAVRRFLDGPTFDALTAATGFAVETAPDRVLLMHRGRLSPTRIDDLISDAKAVSRILSERAAVTPGAAA